MIDDVRVTIHNLTTQEIADYAVKTQPCGRCKVGPGQPCDKANAKDHVTCYERWDAARIALQLAAERAIKKAFKEACPHTTRVKSLDGEFCFDCNMRLVRYRDETRAMQPPAD